MAELQILEPEDTKQMRSVDAAALKLLQDLDDTHMYINVLMKSRENEQNDNISGSPHSKIQGMKRRHANTTANSERISRTHPQRTARPNQRSRIKRKISGYVQMERLSDQRK